MLLACTSSVLLAAPAACSPYCLVCVGPRCSVCLVCMPDVHWCKGRSMLGGLWLGGSLYRINPRWPHAKVTPPYYREQRLQQRACSCTSSQYKLFNMLCLAPLHAGTRLWAPCGKGSLEVGVKVTTGRKSAEPTVRTLKGGVAGPVLKMQPSVGWVGVSVGWHTTGDPPPCMVVTHAWWLLTMLHLHCTRRNATHIYRLLAL